MLKVLGYPESPNQGALFKYNNDEPDSQRMTHADTATNPEHLPLTLRFPV